MAKESITRAKTELFSVSLPVGLKDEFRQACESNGVTMSGTVASLIKTYLQNAGIVKYMSQEKVAIDAAKDYAGTKKVRVAFGASVPLIERVRAIADERHVKLSTIYREVISKWVDGRSAVKGSTGLISNSNSISQGVRLEGAVARKFEIEKKRGRFNTTKLMNDLLVEWLQEQGVEK